MLFFINPYSPQHYEDPEDAYVEFKRREYVAALQEQQRRSQFERELALEEQRHRAALASITQQEAARRRHQHQHQHQPQRQSVPFFVRPAFEQQPSEAPSANPTGCEGRRFCAQPSPEEILRRRRARQEEEERRSREFHEHILSQIFGVATEERPRAAAPAERASSAPAASTSTDKGKGRATEAVSESKTGEPQPHWSAAPERARSLAEITAINRTFTSLRNTFTFPSGSLEQLPGSDVPRLAFNPVNATIHAYDHALSELLTKLDGIESHGFKGVREARKQLVVKIEKELEILEKQIAERLAGAASPVAAVSSIPSTEEGVVHIPIEDASTEMQTDETPVETQALDVTMEQDAPTVDTSTSTATDVSGYDIEPEEVAQPTPVVEIPVQALEKPSTEKDADTSMDVEVTPGSTLDVDSDEHQQSKAVPDQTEVTAPTPAPQESNAEPSTETHAFPPTAVLNVASDDEESEVEDAIHVEVLSEEEDAIVSSHEQDSDHDNFEMI